MGSGESESARRQEKKFIDSHSGISTLGEFVFYSLGAGLFVPAKLLVEHLHDHGTAELRNRVVLHTDRLGHGISETCTALKVDLCAVLVTLEFLDDGPLGVCLLQNSRLSVTVLDRLVQVLDRRLIVVLNSVCLCSISEEK